MTNNNTNWEHQLNMLWYGENKPTFKQVRELLRTENKIRQSNYERLLIIKDRETQEKLKEQKESIVKIIIKNLNYKNGVITLTDLINKINNNNKTMTQEEMFVEIKKLKGTMPAWHIEDTPAGKMYLELGFVGCDSFCGAKEEPETLEEHIATLDHYKHHSVLSGCSHGQ